MSHAVQDATRIIERIEAVQGNAGVGLVRQDVDDIVELFRGGESVARIADVLSPTWRITAVRSEQNRAVDAAVAIRDALAAHQAKWGQL